MKYLCLIYCDERIVETMPSQTLECISGDCARYSDSLRQAGRLIASERLQPTGTATTLRTVDGKVSATDGPFAETKEQLGGFYLIDACDRDEALRIASELPPARLGCVELRPVQEHQD